MENTGAWENSFSLRFIYEGITEGGNDLSIKSRDFLWIIELWIFYNAVMPILRYKQTLAPGEHGLREDISANI